MRSKGKDFFLPCLFICNPFNKFTFIYFDTLKVDQYGSLFFGAYHAYRYI